MTAPLLGPQLLAETRIADRLTTEPIIWLTTVTPAGRPHSVPVWFNWSDPRITVFSRPDTAKVGHLRHNSAVSTALDSAAMGTDIVLGEGDAALAGLDEVADALPAFEAKYTPLLGGQPFRDWLGMFSQPIVITLTKIIAWQRTETGLDYRSIH